MQESVVSSLSPSLLVTSSNVIKVRCGQMWRREFVLISAADLTNQYTPGLLKSNQRAGWQNQRAGRGGGGRKQTAISLSLGLWTRGLETNTWEGRAFLQRILPASGRNLEDPLLNLQFSNRISSIDYFFENHLTVLWRNGSVCTENAIYVRHITMYFTTILWWRSRSSMGRWAHNQQAVLKLGLEPDLLWKQCQQ